MNLDLDPRDPVPLYLQLAAALRRAVLLGALRPGERVPTVRDLAVRARVNRNTAARAIQHLESEGIVRSRVGQGTFVEDGAARMDRQGREAAIDAALDRIVLEAHGLGAPLEELGWRLSRRIEAFRRRREEGERG
jgi:GntR family transcriptional regulator